MFHPYRFGDSERAVLDQDGHFVLPGLLTDAAQEQLTASLAHIQELIPIGVEGHEPPRFAAEFNGYLESVIGHPQMLALVQRVLGPKIRYDHCVALNRPGGNQGSRWHSHEYADDDSHLGFVRIFFYVNGFKANDGGLKVVRGSHLYRDPKINAENDAELEKGWMAGKTHPQTGRPLTIEGLDAPAGSVGTASFAKASWSASWSVSVCMIEPWPTKSFSRIFVLLVIALKISALKAGIAQESVMPLA